MDCVKYEKRTIREKRLRWNWIRQGRIISKAITILNEILRWNDIMEKWIVAKEYKSENMSQHKEEIFNKMKRLRGNKGYDRGWELILCVIGDDDSGYI